jgi:hypothetical protein
MAKDERAVCEAITIMRAADVDRGADFDSVRYVPNHLASDADVPDSFEDADEEARIAALAIL